MASTIEMEVDVQSPIDKFWDAIADSTALFPKIFPHHYKSIEIIEGDGKSVGTVRLLKYAEGFPLITFAKERIDIADEENKKVGYSVIDGEFLTYLKYFKATYHVVPKGDACAVKVKIEMEKAMEEVPDPEIIEQMINMTFKGLDEYLLKN
ncbi:putative MLP-like protein 423 [Iris pallida]|uniref:MLP-like protein 423 n=1 Tax=Iris pallida TaxID=29817 RepID=A0AAX6DP34_IRIPA|nr:putative MLP-like protein 423 [Iris pallida]KAJ6831365.1 putative MLP-like protein 423 [Iris pallida]